MTNHSANARHARRREELRAAGLRRVELWVVDTRRPEFVKEVRRQCRAVTISERRDDNPDRDLEALNLLLVEQLDASEA